MPWFGVNSSREPGISGSLTVPARSAVMHPAPDHDVAVGWRSPIRGKVRLKGKIAMGDSRGGNGIEWVMGKEGPSSWEVLNRGVIGTGGSQDVFSGGSAQAMTGIVVEPGEMLALIVSARDGDHTCDTTVVDWEIAEVDGPARVWNLIEDIADRINLGNPLADGRGNTQVWSFFSVSADQKLFPRVVPSEPPFAQGSEAKSAREFLAELSSKNLKTIRQRVREHAEQNCEDAVAALHGAGPQPTHPRPPFDPAMQIDVPSTRLTDQWRLGAWHILRRSAKDAAGKWHFNDYPFGILASETYMILRALDLQGMHREAADGLDQWLTLPMEPRIVPGGRRSSSLGTS